jgi:hypothetical protein
MKKAYTIALLSLWTLVTVLPSFGYKIVSDPLPAAIAYVGVTIALAILLKDS